MKKTIVTLIIACLLAFGCLFPAFAFADTAMTGDAEQVAAVILHTNDAHVAFEDNIGYDGLALYKKELEEKYDHVLLIDAGDAIQGAPIGSVSKGAEIIRMMNRLGYDLAVPGNHEFDYGLEALDDCAEALDCGYTCANFCVTGGEPVFQPWRILEAGDLKIGFVGAVTPDAYTKSTIKDILNEAGEPMYDFLADETGQRLCVGLQKAIDETRQAGADYVILVSHLGNNDSITEQFRTDAVVGKLRGLDLIIDGHSHETYNRTVTDGENRQVPIAQTGSNMKAIGQIKIYKDGRLEETLIDTVPEPANMPFEKVVRRNVERCVDPEMKAFLDEIVASYAPVMNRKVGEVSYDMIVRDADGFDVSRVEENGLCDFVADAYRTVGGTRAALVNAGAVRNNLKAGTVTYNDILNILPYSNDVVTASVTGQMLLDALEFGVSKLPAVSGGFLQVSGITFRVNPELESSVVVDDKNQFVSVAGEYRVSDVMVGQEPLDQKAEYTLTGTSFLLNGGDGYAMFKEADILSMTMLPDNEVVIKYLEEYLDGVIPEDYREAQGRILITPAAGEEAPAPAESEEQAQPFHYQHDPRLNPYAMEDIVEDENAVYGFRPVETGNLKQYASIAWDDPEEVGKKRAERIAYHDSFSELYDLAGKMFAQGAEIEEIARAVSTRRNELRIKSYEGDPDGLARMKARNLEEYGREEGALPEEHFKLRGSWESVLEGALSVNSGMDACVGLYDDYYDLYVLMGQIED